MSAQGSANHGPSPRHAKGAEIGDIVAVDGRTGEVIGSTDGRPVVRPFPIAEQADWPGKPPSFTAEGELRIVKKHWEWENSAVRKLLHLARSAGERLRSFAQPAASETARATTAERNEVADAFRAWAEARDPERTLRELADANLYRHDRARKLQLGRTLL